MSNQEAIALLRNFEDSLDAYCELNEEGKTAFRMAIESLGLFGNSEHLPSAQPDVHDKNVGEWNMFDLITSAYYGKMMYSKQDNGIVYSRYSCKCMSVDEAIREFLAVIGEDRE